MSDNIEDMIHRIRRLQERDETQDLSDDEEKREDRRLSAGGVLGLNVPAGTPNLRTAQAMCVSEAAATTLDVYNAGGHVIDENTVDEREVSVERVETIAAVTAPSLGHRC